MEIRIADYIKRMTLLDDVFMTAVFKGNTELTAFVLKIILNREFRVKSVRVQNSLTNLKGRSVRLDIYAESADGKKFNIEIQRQDKGAGVKRARYNSSMLDANSLLAGEDFAALPETYVIFITERDVLKLGEPIYFIERMIVGKDKFFNDEAHIVYVNNSIRDDTPLGKLMHDFACAVPNEMFYEEIADSVRIFKEDSKEEFEVSGVMEEFRRDVTAYVTEHVTAQVTAQQSLKMARKMLENGKMTLEEIADICELPPEKVRELAAEKSDSYGKN